MSQNYIPIYDDTVVKMSIKQGLEEDRTAGKDTDAKNLPGYFTIGELAFTRDTYRVFCGNVTNGTEREYQTTLGGSIVGNKYLGLIDSKPDTTSVSEEPEDSSDTIPHFNYKDIKDSSYFQNGDDGYWDVTSSYNKTYGAYKGDFIYDSYRNGLILFDDKIKSAKYDDSNGAKPYGKVGTAVYDFTSDMFGDGYVILYNLIPDGDTITLEDRILTPTGNNVNPVGTTITENNNYNILKINKVTTTHLTSGGCFNGENINGIKNYIDLASTIKVDAINTRAEGQNYLSLPSRVTFGDLSLNADNLDPNNLEQDEPENVDDRLFLCIKDSEISLAKSNVDIDDFSFTLNLGEGLKASTTSDDGTAVELDKIEITNGKSARIDIIPQVEKEEEKEEDIGNRCLTYFKNPYTILKTNNSNVFCRFASNKEVYSTFVQHNTNGTDYNVLGYNNTTAPDNKIFIWPGKLDSDELYNATENARESYYSLACLANDIEQYDNDEDVNSLRTLNKFPLTITKNINDENEVVSFSIEYTGKDGNTAKLGNITNIGCNGFEVSDIEVLKSLGEIIDDDSIKVVYDDINDKLTINKIYKKDGSCISSVITFTFTADGEDTNLEFGTDNYIWSIETDYKTKINSITYYKNEYDENNNKIKHFQLAVTDETDITNDYKVDNIFLLKNSCIKDQVKDEITNKITPVYKIIISYTVNNEEIRETIDLNEYDLVYVENPGVLDINEQLTCVRTGCRYILGKHKELPSDYDSTKILPEISGDATSVILNYEWSGNSQDVKNCLIGYMVDFDEFPASIVTNTSYGIGTISTDTSFSYNIADEHFISDSIIPLILETTYASSKTFEIPLIGGVDGNKYFCLYASENLTINLLGYRV